MSNLIKKIGKVYDRTMKTLGFEDKSKNSKVVTAQSKCKRPVNIQKKGYQFYTFGKKYK